MMSRKLLRVPAALVLGVLLAGCPTPDPVPETIPEEPSITLSLTATSAESVAIEWTAVDGADTYLLYRDAALIHESATAGNTYTDNILQPKTSYSYMVEAKTGGVVAASGSKGISIPGPHLVTKILELSSTAVTLTIEPLNFVVPHHYYMMQLKGPAVGSINGSDTTPTFVITGLVPDSTYTFQGRGIWEGSDGLRRTDTVLSRITTLPAPPQNLTATIAGRVITLGWDAVTGAARYNIYCSFNEAGPYILIGTQDRGTAYFVTALNGGIPLAEHTTYYFKVSALIANENNKETDLSDAVAGTTGS